MFSAPPQYNFVLNPYPDERLSRCPFCNNKTGQRKRPLVIHVDPVHLITLNYTCRYCEHCDLLIAHKHEIEHILYNVFVQRDPSAIGNRYLIMGTVERKVWREASKRPQTPIETLTQARRFKVYYPELRATRPGWYRDDEQPPIMEPPPSQEWVKDRSARGREGVEIEDDESGGI